MPTRIPSRIHFAFVKFLHRLDVAVMLLKTIIMCFNAEIRINLIFKIGKNHIQLLTALVKT